LESSTYLLPFLFPVCYFAGRDYNEDPTEAR